MFSKGVDNVYSYAKGENTSEAEQEDTSSLPLIFYAGMKLVEEAEVPGFDQEALLESYRKWMRNEQALIPFNFYQDDQETAESFVRLTNFMKNTYKSETPYELGDHIIMDLKDQHTLVILMIGEHQWNIVFNNVKCSLGMLRNIIMPKVIRTFNEMNVG